MSRSDDDATARSLKAGEQSSQLGKASGLDRGFCIYHAALEPIFLSFFFFFFPAFHSSSVISLDRKISMYKAFLSR